MVQIIHLMRQFFLIEFLSLGLLFTDNNFNLHAIISRFLSAGYDNESHVVKHFKFFSVLYDNWCIPYNNLKKFNIALHFIQTSIFHNFVKIILYYDKIVYILISFTYNYRPLSTFSNSLYQISLKGCATTHKQSK